MDNKQLASSYATAKCCGFTGSFDEFKIFLSSGVSS